MVDPWHVILAPTPFEPKTAQQPQADRSAVLVARRRPRTLDAMKEETKKPTRTVSSVLADGTIIESIQAEADAPTQLVVARDGEIAVTPHWTHEGVRYAPVRAGHNLLKHRAIRLPGAPQDYGTVETLFDEIEQYAARYLALSSTFSKIAASYTLLSWVYDAFNELPYLRFRGDYGSGKTRALIVFGSIAYKGFFASGASTVSPIFHTLDAFKGTLVFDEADFRFTDEKAELVKILNNGNVKGFSVLRTQVTASKEFEPRAFSVYGPKIVAMRGSYEDRALESRFLTEEMSGRSLRADIPISLPEAQDIEAHELRSKLLMYRLKHRALACIDLSLADPALEPRMNQILLPLLSVAPTKEAQDAIRAYAAQVQEAVLSDRAGSTEGQLLSVIAGCVAQGERPILPLQEIVTQFVEKYGSEYDRPVTNRFLGSVLRNRLGLPLYKTNGVIAVSLKDRARLTTLLARYGVGESESKSAA